MDDDATGILLLLLLGAAALFLFAARGFRKYKIAYYSVFSIGVFFYILLIWLFGYLFLLFWLSCNTIALCTQFVTSIPVFFLLSAVLKKMRVTHLFWRATGTFLLTPIVYSLLFGATYLIIDSTISWDRKFTKEDWFAHADKRYELTNDLAKSMVLLGKSKAEVAELLGWEKNDNSTDYWGYYLGETPLPEMLEKEEEAPYLMIYFKEDKVAGVYAHVKYDRLAYEHIVTECGNAAP